MSEEKSNNNKYGHMNNDWSSMTHAIHSYYDPQLSVGAIKPPLYATSTFVAQSASELAGWFTEAYGLDNGVPRNPSGLIYSRLVNPNVAIYEHRLATFEKGGTQAALFSSGMAALSTTFLTLLKPNDTLVHAMPCYGGTDYLIQHVLPQWNINVAKFDATDKVDQIEKVLNSHKNIKVIFVETPTNPTLRLADIVGIKKTMNKVCPDAVLVVDNTVLGPRYCSPISLGADISVFSATKSLGGHSDLIAGAIIGKSEELIGKIKASRTILGSINDPHTAFMLLRSLETYTIRVEASNYKALKVVNFLKNHEKIESLFYPGFETNDEEQLRRYNQQCTGSGSLISFCVKGNKENAYKVLDNLKCINLAVSLGGTESLAEHPASHTHSDVSKEDRQKYNIADNLVRISVGLEDADDLIADLKQALEQV